LVFNVFITPIFSFVQQFYVMPSLVYQDYTSLMMKLISPWNGTAWPYSQLVAPFNSGGFRQPLVDPWVFGTTLLLRHVDFRAITEPGLPWGLDGKIRRGDSFRSLNYDSPLLTDHYNLALMEFLGDEYLGWDGQASLDFTKKDIKNIALKHGILHYTGPRNKTKNDLRKDFYHHLVDRYKEHGSIASSNSLVHFKGLPKRTPAFLVTHFIKALCNALPTDSKRRFVNPECSLHPAKSPTNMYPCYFCDFGDAEHHGDRNKHIFNDCPTTRTAISDALKSEEGPGDPSLLSMYGKKTTPLYILDFPTASSHYKYSRLGFILCALWSIWSTLEEIKKGRSRSGAASRITQRILAMSKIWSGESRSGATCGNASNRSTQQMLKCKVDADKLISSFPTNSILVYTDGSSLGNPGPAGAGAYITSSGVSAIKILCPLGHSTNNVGEMWAIGMALLFIRKDVIFGNLSETRPIYILSDSLVARNAINNGTAVQKQLRAMITRIRELADTFEPKRPKIYWVPGHSGVIGNEIADSLATEASSRSENTHSDGSMADCLEFFSDFQWTAFNYM
jgi:ribonuclease HI